MGKLEYKSKSLDFDSNNAKITHIVLGDDVGSIVHEYLDGDLTDLSNAELFKLAWDKHYQINYPGKAEKEKFDELQKAVNQANEAVDVTNKTAEEMRELLNQYRKDSQTAQATVLEVIEKLYEKGILTDDEETTTNTIKVEE